MTKARQRERQRRRQAELNEAIRRERQAELQQLQKDEEVDRIFNMLLEARFGRKDRYAGWELDAACKELDEAERKRFAEQQGARAEPSTVS
jgi:hypothetical protein